MSLCVSFSPPPPPPPPPAKPASPGPEVADSSEAKPEKEGVETTTETGEEGDEGEMTGVVEEGVAGKGKEEGEGEGKGEGERGKPMEETGEQPQTRLISKLIVHSLLIGTTSLLHALNAKNDHIITLHFIV